MENIALIYGYILAILTAIFTISFLWRLLQAGARPINGISRRDWSVYGWIFSMILVVDATLLYFSDAISKEILNFRIWQHPFVNLIDILFILHIFFGLLLIIHRVRRIFSGEESGKLSVPIQGKLNAFLILLFLPEYHHFFGYITTISLVGFYVILGGSLYLIIVLLIPIIFIKIFFGKIITNNP